MPRLLRYRQKTTEERAALKYGVRGYKRWVDPFPGVHGTLPEKIVYSKLSQMGIPFLFLNDINFNIPEIEFNKYYQADFVIPSLRIIIEVQGAFWHSKPKAIESDAFKFAIYEMTGWKVLAWWDYEIIDNVNLLVAKTPELLSIAKYQTSGSKELPPERRTKVDTSQGIRTLNKKRGARLAYRKKPVTIKSSKKKAFQKIKVNAK
jgi:very-short-patch-repair endonuclease